MKSKESYFQNWKSEREARDIYLALAKIESGTKKGELFTKLAQESFHQSEIWLRKSPDGQNWIYQPDFKTRIVIKLIQKFGPRFFIDLLSGMKIRGISLYRLGDTHLTEAVLNNEKIHSKIAAGSNLRAAIFGINDGLVSNASLVFAMVGAHSESKILILTGVAGLLAGALSMATGEYISVKSQTELFENQIALEREELHEFPEEEAKELSMIYQAKGVETKLADDIAFSLVKDKEKALDTLAREELGLNPSELGSPLGAAISSFICFAIGASIPLFPFLLMTPTVASSTSFMLSLGTLFLTGVLISFLTGKSLILSGLRMCLLGLLSGGTTYFIGHLIGVSVN